jgi:GNAT superfamily N-acetyltransferase
LKGQHLFVRPAEAQDETALRAFFVADSASVPASLTGPVALVAKLAGTIVAHAGGDVEGGALRIESFYVSRDLRRKRIGRGLLRRLEELAAGMHCSRLVAPEESPCDRFFERAGFSRDGEFFIKEIKAL